MTFVWDRWIGRVNRYPLVSPPAGTSVPVRLGRLPLKCGTPCRPDLLGCPGDDVCSLYRGGRKNHVLGDVESVRYISTESPAMTSQAHRSVGLLYATPSMSLARSSKSVTTLSLRYGRNACWTRRMCPTQRSESTSPARASTAMDAISQARSGSPCRA
jgi:hypothetical protein